MTMCMAAGPSPNVTSILWSELSRQTFSQQARRAAGEERPRKDSSFRACWPRYSCLLWRRSTCRVLSSLTCVWGFGIKSRVDSDDDGNHDIRGLGAGCEVLYTLEFLRRRLRVHVLVMALQKIHRVEAAHQRMMGRWWVFKTTGRLAKELPQHAFGAGKPFWRVLPVACANQYQSAVNMITVCEYIWGPSINLNSLHHTPFFGIEPFFNQLIVQFHSTGLLWGRISWEVWPDRVTWCCVEFSEAGMDLYAKEKFLLQEGIS